MNPVRMSKSVAKPTKESRTTKRKNNYIVPIIASGGALIIFILIALFIKYFKDTKKKFPKEPVETRIEETDLNLNKTEFMVHFNGTNRGRMISTTSSTAPLLCKSRFRSVSESVWSASFPLRSPQSPNAEGENCLQGLCVRCFCLFFSHTLSYYMFCLMIKQHSLNNS